MKGGMEWTELTQRAPDSVTAVGRRLVGWLPSAPRLNVDVGTPLPQPLSRLCTTVCAAVASVGGRAPERRTCLGKGTTPPLHTRCDTEYTVT